MNPSLPLLACFLFLSCIGTSTQATPPKNLLIITVDDMSADSIGAFGCKLPDTSPHIDQLAMQGMRFDRAHVQVGNCMPSRNVMFSGRYPHRNGIEGFRQLKNPTYPVMVDLMKQAGFFTAIRGKVSHSTPYHPYAWDLVLGDAPDGKPYHVKDIESYGIVTKQGIDAARKAGKPFCLLINVSDPHKPFYAEGKQGITVPDPHVPSRVFTPDEVPIPGFLVDDPVIRKELAHYYSSVRRADDCVGRVLQSLDESGLREDTAIVFLSDHGMPLPFAKTQVYHHSSKSPWIIKVPGLTKAAAVDPSHLISSVDLLPTLLDLFELPQPEGMDGRSFLPLLRGEPQSGRDFVFKEHNLNAGGFSNPMRAVESSRYLYIFNPWSNGERKMATATAGTSTYRQLKKLAATDTAIAARMQLFDYRLVEEFYDMENDPAALNNLITHPDHQTALAEYRKQMEQWMERTQDPLLEVFRNREDIKVREAYMAKHERVAGDVADDDDASPSPNMKKNRAAGRAAPPNAAQGKIAPGKTAKGNYFQWSLPTGFAAGEFVKVQIEYQLPENLGEQLLQVTMKDAGTEARMERQTFTIQGKGSKTIEFRVPPGFSKEIRFAAFIGAEFTANLQYQQSAAIPPESNAAN